MVPDPDDVREFFTDPVGLDKREMSCHEKCSEESREGGE